MENADISELMTLPVFGANEFSGGSDAKLIRKSALEEVNDFQIDPSRITKITTEDYTSYTAVIIRSTPSKNYFENIVVMQWIGKPEAQAFLIKYSPSTKVNFLEEHNSFSFEGIRSVRPITIEENNFPIYKGSTSCGSSYEWWCDYSRPHVAGPDCFAANDGRVYLKTIPDVMCTEPGSTGGGGGSDGSYPGTDGPGPGTGGGGDFESGEDQPVITLPMYPDGTSATPAFLTNILGITNSKQINYINDNPQFANELLNFIISKGSTREVKSFAKETIHAITFNPDFEIDLNRSYISPYKIDLSNVIPNPFRPEPEREKFMYIYDRLLETSFFKDVITDVFGTPTSKMNVTFMIVDGLTVGDNPANGSTKYSIVTGVNPLVDNSITIKIDKDYLLSQPLIRIAKTIVHEVAHTHLALVNIDSPSAVQIGDYSPEDFARLLDDHFALDGDEHEFMAQHYIPVISNAVEEILPLLESKSRIDYIGTLFHFEGVDNLGLWDWNDFFKYISWSGLESTDFFDSQLNKGLISISLYNSYNNYSKVGKDTSNQFSIQP